MSNVIRAQLGAHVPIRVRARERRSDSANGQLFALNGMHVSAIKDPTGTLLAANTYPTFHFVKKGEYITHWDTSGLSVAGDYQFEILAHAGWDTVAQTRKRIPKKVIIRLLKWGAP